MDIILLVCLNLTYSWKEYNQKGNLNLFLLWYILGLVRLVSLADILKIKLRFLISFLGWSSFPAEKVIKSGFFFALLWNWNLRRFLFFLYRGLVCLTWGVVCSYWFLNSVLTYILGLIWWFVSCRSSFNAIFCFPGIFEKMFHHLSLFNCFYNIGLLENHAFL